MIKTLIGHITTTGENVYFIDNPYGLMSFYQTETTLRSTANGTLNLSEVTLLEDE